jgi:hypothetical protein
VISWFENVPFKCNLHRYTAATAPYRKQRQGVGTFHP